MPFPLKLCLIHPKAAMCHAFTKAFQRFPDITVLQTRYEDLEAHDCFVTAGNSYGIMNAGVDAAVAKIHGPDFVATVQWRILNDYLGEQPVGTAFIQETDCPDFPYIAHAPTMRTPGSIENTDNVYRATWGALLAVYHHNLTSERKIKTLVFPAFGAGFGRVTYREVARQMAAAYDHYLHPPHRLNWDTAVRRRKAIAYDGSKRALDK